MAGNGQGFWRNWHSSFNAWLVRYLYIPLGGNRHRCLVIWPVFLFVAVWHDIEARLVCCAAPSAQGLTWAGCHVAVALTGMGNPDLPRVHARNVGQANHACAGGTLEAE